MNWTGFGLALLVVGAFIGGAVPVIHVIREVRETWARGELFEGLLLIGLGVSLVGLVILACAQ